MVRERGLAVAAMVFAIGVGTAAIGSAVAVLASADAQAPRPKVCDAALRISSFGGVSAATEDQGGVGPDGCDLSPGVAHSWAESQHGLPLVMFDCSVVYPTAYTGRHVDLSQVPRSPEGYCLRV